MIAMAFTDASETVSAGISDLAKSLRYRDCQIPDLKFQAGVLMLA